MPRNRNRPGHPYHNKADIPIRQRVKGRVIWAILLAMFGVLIALFAASINYITLTPALVISAIIGYVISQKMEKDATHKT